MNVSLIRRARLALALPAAALVMGAAAWHITPTVVLNKQADVIKATLPEARSFFVRDVKIGKEALAAIRRAADFTPDEDEFKFYYGKTADGDVAGVVFFPQVNTQHGPFEVGVAVDPSGTVTKVVATKATVETKPWVEKAIEARLLERFDGMHPGDDVGTALKGVSKAEIGAMPYYVAEELTKAVGRGLALYRALYR
jgi:hypothetical protein